MSKKTDYTGEAAGKVFEVGELLESILICLSDDEEFLYGIPCQYPISKLFVIQRVNRTFKATIEGSPKLRKLMWLEQVNIDAKRMKASKELRYLRITSLDWLLLWQTDEGGREYYYQSLNGFGNGRKDKLRHECFYLPEASQQIYDEKLPEPSVASWTKMKALLVTTGREAVLTLDVFEHFTLEDFDSSEDAVNLDVAGDILKENGVSYQRDIAISEEDCLAPIFDKLKKIDEKCWAYNKYTDDVPFTQWG